LLQVLSHARRARGIMLQQLCKRIGSGETELDALFPGIAGVRFTAEGTGPEINLRIVKKEGIPVTLVAASVRTGLLQSALP
jgi:hypothetical protein